MLKAPPRGFHGLEKYDEREDATSISPDNLRPEVNMDSTDGVQLLREDSKGILV